MLWVFPRAIGLTRVAQVGPPGSLLLAQWAEGQDRAHAPRPKAEMTCVFVAVPFLLPFRYCCRDKVVIQSRLHQDSPRAAGSQAEAERVARLQAVAQRAEAHRMSARIGRVALSAALECSWYSGYE